MTDTLRHALYELCVQSPRHIPPMLAAIHAGDNPYTSHTPLVLGEDFAGTAAISHEWIKQARDDQHHQAVAVDLDADALGHRPPHKQIKIVKADILACEDPCDILFVGNFSIGYHHTRSELVRYLTHARQRLANAPCGKGVFICDTYGGETAFITGEVHRDHWIAGAYLPAGLETYKGQRCRYTWEQRDADPITGMVTDVCHFLVIDADGSVQAELPDAFTYRWRLWSIPELADALAEAGFTPPAIYDKTPDAIDEDGNAYMTPVTEGQDLDDSYIVCVAAGVAL